MGGGDNGQNGLLHFDGLVEHESGDPVCQAVWCVLVKESPARHANRVQQHVLATTIVGEPWHRQGLSESGLTGPQDELMSTRDDLSRS